MAGKALLIILDGFGLRDEVEGNAIKLADTPVLGRFNTHLSRTHLETSGEAVGLPAGQMGNSEVGHMNIGAGRVIHQMLLRIDIAIRDGTFADNAVLGDAMRHALQHDGRLHLMGLVSDGGVHSSQQHLHALLEMAAAAGLGGDRVVIHAFTDGRDTSPTGGQNYLDALQAAADKAGAGVIATVTGRYWAMDRDKRWDRTHKAYEAIVMGRGQSAPAATDYMATCYQEDTTDEFVEPAVIRPDLHMRDGDAAVFFNFRPDRARQLTRALGEKSFDGFDVTNRPDIYLATMTRYEDSFPYPYAYADQRPKDTLGEVVAAAGLRQMRIAETEKYAHVTYFLNGGAEAAMLGEKRVVVQSPKDVATYDEKPAMSAAGITDAAERAVADGYDLIVINYANCDMVGHTGSMAATVRAVEEVDACLGRLLAAAEAGDYHVFITADHGNAEQMTNPDGSPQTAHTTQPVPLFYVGPTPGSLRPGILADVAPTLLATMGLSTPAAMTGQNLFSRP